ncbi:hypothetical protein [Clostridium akagii]|uniref:hypothetical protein n=1 Tax=Clostridium akagii TaxID=91623 RepID=UPI00047E0E87|nr:hypothetical protein [Clostridium akagii]
MDATIVGIICGIGGLAIGFLGFVRNTKQDTRQDTQEQVSNSTRVEIKLDYAITGINEIKADTKDTKKDVIAVSERLLKVEESAKSAHHRLDRIEDIKE